MFGSGLAVSSVQRIDVEKRCYVDWEIRREDKEGIRSLDRTLMTTNRFGFPVCGMLRQSRACNC